MFVNKYFIAAVRISQKVNCFRCKTFGTLFLCEDEDMLDFHISIRVPLMISSTSNNTVYGSSKWLLKIRRMRAPLAPCKSVSRTFNHFLLIFDNQVREFPNEHQVFFLDNSWVVLQECFMLVFRIRCVEENFTEHVYVLLPDFLSNID